MRESNVRERAINAKVEMATKGHKEHIDEMRNSNFRKPQEVL
jgi:hypothetical protein